MSTERREDLESFRSRSRSPPGRQSRSRSRSPEDNKVNSKRIYVSNIAFEAKWMNLKDLFKKEVGDVTYVEMFNGANGRSIGTGLVEFNDIESAQRAVDLMHQFDFMGRKIVVREERLSDTRRLQRIREDAKRSKMNDDNVSMNSMGGGGGGGGGGGMMNNMGNMNMGMGGMQMGNTNMNMLAMNNYGLTPQVMNQLGIDGPLTNQVFIANLDYKVDDRKLRDIFKMAGRIEHLQLKTDKDGKSRGLAICRYEYPFEAAQAISMFNTQHLYDRPISVRMDKMAADSNNSAQQSDKLPAGLRSIGNGLGFGGNPLMMNSMNLNPSNMAMGSNNYMNMNGLMGMNNMSAMGMNNMSGMGNNMANMNSAIGGNMMGGLNNSDMMSGGMSSAMSSGMSNGMSGGMSNNMPSMGGGLMNNMNNGMGQMGMGMKQMDNMGSGMNNNMSMTSNLSTNTSNNQSRSNDRGRLSSGSLQVVDENSSIYVRDLPYVYTWQDLKERFRHIGDVRYAAIKTENGKSKGCGVVRFSNSEHARMAVQTMHGTRIDGRQIDVTLLAKS